LSFESLADDLYKNRLTLAAILITAILAMAAIYYLLPLADGIVFGVFFFFIVRPVKEYLDKYTKFSPYLATFCLVLPFIALVIYGIISVWGEAQWILGHGQELNAIVDQVEAGLALPFDLGGAISEALKGSYDYAIAYLKTIPLRSTFSGLVSLAMNALISLFVCFYLLKDGGSFVKSLRELAPAGRRHVLDTFLAEADRLLSGIYTGTFYTALFVAIGSLVVFIIFGIPYKALLTAFVFIAAMVPILSGMMVFIPVTVYVYLDRSPLVAALFLGTAVIFIYLPPDFIIRPYLINRASKLHPLLIILAFIGGGVAGGLSGFFAAPLVIGLVTAIYRTYKKTAYQERDEGLH
jgi:predicted PurR-regulated permease PerM